MTMTEFEDRLIEDLLNEHGSALAVLDRPAPRRRSHRPLWIGTGAAVAVAGAVAVGLTLTGAGDAPAYAVTQNANGTVTLSVTKVVGITGANDELRRLHLPVVIAPLDDSCQYQWAQESSMAAILTHMNPTTVDGVHQLTFALDRIPAGDTLVVSVGPLSRNSPLLPPDGKGSMVVVSGLAVGRPPTCSDAASAAPSASATTGAPSASATSAAPAAPAASAAPSAPVNPSSDPTAVTPVTPPSSTSIAGTPTRP